MRSATLTDSETVDTGAARAAAMRMIAMPRSFSRRAYKQRSTKEVFFRSLFSWPWATSASSSDMSATTARTAIIAALAIPNSSVAVHRDVSVRVPRFWPNEYRHALAVAKNALAQALHVLRVRIVEAVPDRRRVDEVRVEVNNVLAGGEHTLQVSDLAGFVVHLTEQGTEFADRCDGPWRRNGRSVGGRGTIRGSRRKRVVQEIFAAHSAAPFVHPPLPAMNFAAAKFCGMPESARMANPIAGRVQAVTFAPTPTGSGPGFPHLQSSRFRAPGHMWIE